MTRLSLKQMILNVIDNNPRGYAEELAEEINYSSGSALKKVLKDENKEFDKFKGLVNLVEFIWKNDSVEMMVQYSSTVDPNKKTARIFLEYLANNRQFEALNNLIDKMDACSNKESIEWARIYRMQYKYEQAHTTEEFETLLKQINHIHVTIAELKVYKKMLMNYCFDQLKDYNMVKMLSKDLKSEIEVIENEYLKEMYTLRSNEIMSYNYLRVLNNPEAARNCTDIIINSNVKTSYKAYANYIKGLSYLFTSHDKAITYLTESKSLYQSVNREHDVNELNEEIEFVKVYWGKYDEDKCAYVKNQMLLDIKKGKDISNELLTEKENIDPEFYLYLEGCNGNNNKKLLLSLIKFMKKSDLFLANLAKIELLKNGYDEEILEELI